MASFANFLILWVSNLNKETSISNLNSEYVKLYIVRDLLPLKSLIK